MTEGFGRKWKDFFYSLEDHYGLDVSDPYHIWLLQRLFLPEINEDALAWAEAWNSHKIQLDGEPRSSPRQLFVISAVTDGVHGLPPQEEGSGDYSLYGVDWDAMERIRGATGDESSDSQPEWVNNVVCEPPNCPLSDEQVERLMEDLVGVVDMESKSMDSRQVAWVEGLKLLLQLVGDG